MKVAVVNLTSGGFSGGYRKYLQHMMPLLNGGGIIERADHFFPPKTETKLLEGWSHLHSWPSRDSWTGWRTLRSSICALSPDVVFIPTGHWVNCGPIPTVVMVRNMEPLLAPFGGNPLAEGLKNIARARSARKACRKATRVIAVSQFVREFLESRWGIPGSKVGLVYHGIESPVPREEASWNGAAENLQEKPFLFTAGSIRPARGLEDLLRASALAFTDTDPWRIVVGGICDPGLESHQGNLKKLAEKLGVSSRFVWAGKLTASEMAWCFYNAEGFVVTSRAEACPNLALEAMNYGCRVVSTRQPPMPEFFGDAALYYAPTNAPELADKLSALLKKALPEDRERRLMAEQRAREFTWEITARKTVEELQRAVGTARG